MSNDSETGKIGWIDMTANDAPAVRGFYKVVVGWLIYIMAADVDASARACTENGGSVAALYQP